jgi:hypothetical protein
MILTILSTYAILSDHNWCISKVPRDDLGVLLFITLLELANALLISLIVWFLLK